MNLKSRIGKLEDDRTNEVVELKTIPEGSSLAEATRIYEDNLKACQNAPQSRSGASMSLDDATAIYESSRLTD